MEKNICSVPQDAWDGVFMQFKLLVETNSSDFKISAKQVAFAWVLGNCRNKVAHH